jgi:hypothetical protein
MKLTNQVRDELKDLYSNLRDAQEEWKAATDAVAAKCGVPANVVRTRIKLEATGKLEKYEENAQMVLAL